jgi:hypothetical protein
MRDRETLIARIRHLRRIKPAGDTGAQGAARGAEGAAAEGAEGTAPGAGSAGAEGSGPEVAEGGDAQGLAHLEARIAHLEQLVEGLQDSVHRETQRQGKLIAELQAQVHPEAMSAALSKDARERGL